MRRSGFSGREAPESRRLGVRRCEVVNEDGRSLAHAPVTPVRSFATTGDGVACLEVGVNAGAVAPAGERDEDGGRGLACFMAPVNVHELVDGL